MSYGHGNFGHTTRFGSGLLGSVGSVSQIEVGSDPTDANARPTLTLVSEGIDLASATIDESADEQWQERALCAQTDPEAFFPEKGGSTREAKRICMGCEVRDECLEYALAHDERFGIWGGLSERERRRLKRGIV